MTEPEAVIDRERFTRTVIELIGAREPQDVRELTSEMTTVLDRAGNEEIVRLMARLRETGASWGYHEQDPLARRLARVILRVLLSPASVLHDAHHLEVARTEPVVFLGNHLSLVDANVFEHLVDEAGFPEISERITVLVGPKVYSMALRRLASLCFGVVKLPQSPSRASDEAVMPSREVARLALDSIRTAGERHAAGEHLLIFVEGTRSRSGSLQRGLAAVTRYLEPPARWVVPFGVWGSEKLLPLGDERVQRARAEARVGRPIRTEELFRLCGGKRPLIIDVVGFLIASLLPAPYRGFYAEPQSALEEPFGIARELR